MNLDENTHRAERRTSRAPAANGQSRHGHAGATADAPLPAARVIEVRRRIVRGAYDSAEVVDSVVRRILASGDL